MRATPYELVDRILDGHLSATLLRWKDEEDLSLADMVHRLRDEHDLTVSVETVRRWLVRAAEDTPSGSTAGAA